MKAPAFDAVLDFPLGGSAEIRGEAAFLGGSVPARFVDYGLSGRKKEPFVRIVLDLPVEVRWADPFEVRTEAGGVLGRGRCLFPNAPSSQEMKPSKRKAVLTELEGGEKEMILALAGLGGLKGLAGEDLEPFARLSRSRVEDLARSLEEEGKVRILGFAPLRLIAQSSLDFLKSRLVAFLVRYHKGHPSQRGIPMEKLEQKFEAPKTVLRLALRNLAKEGRAVEEAGIVRLPDFNIPLSAPDEETLASLEALVLSGEIGSITLDEIRDKLTLTPGKLQTMMAVLAERKKIVQGIDGFILHQQWLDEIVRRIRESGKRELTVADFKAMTGLSRKYSIPLLELLDSLGVTRRKGSVRDILK
jgi:selenocysteine-specific elongation factor